MMLSVVLIPYLLVLKVPEDGHIKNETHGFLFNYNKTTVVHREPIQTTQLNASLICHPSNNTLSCFLHDIMFLSTLQYKNVNITNQVWKEYINITQWFEIHFDQNGAELIRLKRDHDKLVLSIATEIGDLLKMDSDAINQIVFMKNNFSNSEKTLIGRCTTKYDINAIFKKSDEQTSKSYRIIPAAMERAFSETKSVRVQIDKDRKSCHHPLEFITFLNGMKVDKYTYTMKIVGNKLRISSTMNVQLPPDPWNHHGTPVFMETTVLQLSGVKLLGVKDTLGYDWTTIPIN